MKKVVAVIAAAGWLALMFPPYNFLPIFAPLPLAALFWVGLSTKRFWIHSALYAVTFFVILIKWMNVVGTDAWILLSLICASWWSLAGFLVQKLTQNNWWPLKAAVVYSALEILRDRIPFQGFGWGQVGTLMAQSEWKVFLPLVGQVGATFTFFLVSALLAQRGAKLISKKFILVSVSTIAVALFSTQMVSVDETQIANIGLVQGGVVHTGLGTFGPPRAVLKKHIETTLKHQNSLETVDLVVWPESSSDMDPTQDSTSNLLIQNTVDTIGKPFLIGANLNLSNTTLANTSLLWTEFGPQVFYQKRRLVPFGEFLPLRELITSYSADRANMLSRDFVPGSNKSLITVNGVKLNVIICFEIADDSLAFQDATEASAVIVHTNNATYQKLGQSEQQLLSARVRAIEMQRSVLSVSTSGLSAVVRPDGSIEQSLSQDQIGVIVTEVPKTSGQTIAVLSHPLWVSGLILGFAYILLSTIRSRRKVAP